MYMDTLCFLITMKLISTIESAFLGCSLTSTSCTLTARVHWTIVEKVSKQHYGEESKGDGGGGGGGGGKNQ